MKLEFDIEAKKRYNMNQIFVIIYLIVMVILFIILGININLDSRYAYKNIAQSVAGVFIFIVGTSNAIIKISKNNNISTDPDFKNYGECIKANIIGVDNVYSKSKIIGYKISVEFENHIIDINFIKNNDAYEKLKMYANRLENKISIPILIYKCDKMIYVDLDSVDMNSIM